MSQKSLNGIHFGEIKQWTCVVILMDFSYLAQFDGFPFCNVYKILQGRRCHQFGVRTPLIGVGTPVPSTHTAIYRGSQ